MVQQNFQGRPDLARNPGLYEFGQEHDACGVGLIADLDNRKSHRIVEMGMEALRRLTHRGATGYDPETGDGAGILIQIPDELYRREKALKSILPPAGEYALAMLFLPTGKEEMKQALALFEKCCALQGWAHSGRNARDSSNAQALKRATRSISQTSP